MAQNRHISKNQKRLARKFLFMVNVLQFLLIFHGKVVSTLPSALWAGSCNSTPCESSRGKFSIMMRMRVKNESSEGKNEIEIENETSNFQEWGSD